MGKMFAFFCGGHVRASAERKGMILLQAEHGEEMSYGEKLKKAIRKGMEELKRDIILRNSPFRKEEIEEGYGIYEGRRK